MQVGYEKLGIFDQYFAISKQYKRGDIDSVECQWKSSVIY